jgi:hypothetical protein
VSPPAILIEIRLEAGRPRVYIDARDEGEFLRLGDWLWSKPDLAELIRLAVELQNEERVA